MLNLILHPFNDNEGAFILDKKQLETKVANLGEWLLSSFA